MSTVTSRVCQACGLCCNGVLFHTVRLQPQDSAQELKSQGMLLQHKKKYDFFSQPCTLLRNNCCSIYNQRPTRCRIFECKQLKKVCSGEITEESALETIRKAHAQVIYLQKLLQEAGSYNIKKPLSKEYKKITAVPVDASEGKNVVEHRLLLEGFFNNFNDFLNQHFRHEPIFI